MIILKVINVLIYYKNILDHLFQLTCNGFYRFSNCVKLVPNHWRAHQYKNPTVVAWFRYAWSITVDKSYQKPCLKNGDPSLNCQSIVTYEWLLAVELLLLSLALDDLLDEELFMSLTTLTHCWWQVCWQNVSNNQSI